MATILFTGGFGMKYAISNWSSKPWKRMKQKPYVIKQKMIKDSNNYAFNGLQCNISSRKDVEIKGSGLCDLKLPRHEDENPFHCAVSEIYYLW